MLCDPAASSPVQESSRVPSRFEQKELLTEQSKFRFMPVSETLTV